MLSSFNACFIIIIIIIILERRRVKSWVVLEANLGRRCFHIFSLSLIYSLSYVFLSWNLEWFWRQILAVVAFTFLSFSHLFFYLAFIFNFFYLHLYLEILKSWVVLEADLGRRCLSYFALLGSALLLSYFAARQEWRCGNCSTATTIPQQWSSQVGKQTFCNSQRRDFDNAHRFQSFQLQFGHFVSSAWQQEITKIYFVFLVLGVW